MLKMKQIIIYFLLFRLTFNKKMWRHSWGSYEDRDDENDKVEQNLIGQKRNFEMNLKV